MKNKSFIFCLALFLFAFAGKANAQVMIIETVAGTGAGGALGDGLPATGAQLNGNYGIALDAAGTNLYIADQSNNKIRKINLTTGIMSTFCGTGAVGSTGDGSPAIGAKLNGPTGVATDPAGNVYIADAGNNKIRMVSAGTGFISTIAGTGAAGFSGDGGPAISAKLSTPKCVALDAAGDVFFTDCDSMHIRMIAVPVTSGNISTVAGIGAPGGFAGDGAAAVSAKLNAPRGVIVDASGNFYIGDMSNNRIRLVTASSGDIATIAGSTPGFSGDGGLAFTSKLDGPVGVNFDPLGNLAVSDATNNRIRLISASTGFINTVAGSNAFGGFGGDGLPATSARLNGPVAVAYLSNGSYYISDRSNNRIRYVSPDHRPTFNGGTRQTLTVCENSGANSINSLLAATDSDLNQSLKWTQVLAPLHGALALAGNSSTNSISVTPAGKTYTPTIGYSGLDSFYVQVSDSFMTSVDTIIVTINPLPTVAAITGPNTVCQLATVNLSDITTGGTWTSGTTTVATVDPTFGIVTGVSGGVDIITYTVTNACGPTSVFYTMTVNPLPNAGSITGATFVCMGSFAFLSDVSGSGVWSSTNTSVATVSSGGLVSPVAPGSDNIDFTVTNICGSATATYPINVIALPDAGTITGPTSVCVLATINLSDAVSGGLWSETSGDAGVSSGAVTGIAAGTDLISYSYTNLCGTAYATYNITVNPLPVAGPISGPVGVCIGGTITLSDAISGVWSSTNTSVATVDPVSGVVTGMAGGGVTIDNTVTNICGSASTSYPITVITIPSAGTITGPTSVCVAATINLSDAIAGGAWTTSNSSATVSGSGMVTGAAGGIDTITYSVSYSCGSANTTYTVTINPLADPGTITGGASVCIGSSVSLSDATIGGVWSSSNTGIATVSGGVVSSVALGVANILYSVTNGCGTVAATQSVTVSPIVTPKVSISSLSGFTTCISVPVTYTANPVNGGALPTYQWNVNGTIVATGANYTYTPANGDIIACTMTSSAPCVSTTIAADTIKVVVNPDVTPSVTISTGAYGDTVCAGTPTTYTATAVNGGTLPSYQWSVNGVVSGVGNPFIYIPVSTGDYISCTLTSNKACSVPATAVSNTITMSVMTSEIPTISIWASPGSNVCQSTTVTYTANIIYGGVPPFMRWTKNGINVATGPTYNDVPLNGDVVYCMLASSSACLAATAYDSVFSNHITMSVVPNVPPTVTISGNAAGNVVNAGQNDVFTAKVTNLTLLTTYQWEVNGVQVPGATANTFTFNEEGAGTAVVNCVVGSGDVCNTIGISNLVNVTISDVGVQQLDAANAHLMLMPNPNKGSFTIEGTMSSDNTTVTLEIMDIVGQVVYKDVAPVQNGKLDKQVSMGNELANGVYMLHIISGDAHDVIRFSLNR